MQGSGSSNTVKDSPFIAGTIPGDGAVETLPRQWLVREAIYLPSHLLPLRRLQHRAGDFREGLGPQLPQVLLVLWPAGLIRYSQPIPQLF